ncbi:EmrB/QacA subfamily drug resistance transporter [Silvibacterium bohemicum]|uniref:EmrB/QacA subfamily drug resistance transporter n=1 Tax=Silvibacterium bohemicum TaxID=1577686 RepID=A0A841JSZ5_9BACT|nr:DHA2 family efflux MFS transporter permease subunit [Silvibacterium bohemicum]MBB6144446.1 EmrB/QacA subfamily drug resistance transporter [Silvibacterium bohemicum]
MATILGSSLAFMDGSVVNVALPTLQANFKATSAGIQWVVQSYALFSAALLLLGGAIGDRYGRRRAFLWGVMLFALASAACAASISIAQLITARAVQGIGAALLIPQGLSILSASFEPDRRGRAIGTWSAWTSVFAALGPVAGGWLMQAWSWRLIFLLNLPLALIVILLAPRIPESRAVYEGKPAQPLDRLGATLATSAFAAIIYALSFAPEFGWRDPRVLWLFVTGLALLAAFLRSQSGRASAMMPLSLFRIPRFLAANLLTFLLYGALVGALYVTPFYLIQIRHYAPAKAGAVFLPLIALMFIFSTRVGALIPRIGESVLLSVGATLAGAGFVAFALSDRQNGYVRAILPGVLLLGAGMTCVVAPLTTAVMSSVPENSTGIASAVNNAFSRLAGLISVSLLSLVLAHGFATNLSVRLGYSGLPLEARAEMLTNRSRLHAAPIPLGLTPNQRNEAESLLDAAFLSGFRSVMFACAAGAWVGAFAVLVLLRKPALETDGLHL